MEQFWKNILTLDRISSVTLIVIGLIGIIICSRSMVRNKRPRYLWVIPLYFLLITSQLLMGIYCDLFGSKSIDVKRHPAHIFLTIYLVLEYTIIAFLLSKFIKSKKINLYLISTTVFYSLFLLYCWYTIISWPEFLSMVSTVGSILLIFPSLYFFYELMRDLPSLRLSSEPSFWIVTGILFLFLWITPIYLALKTISTVDLKVIDHLAYATLIVLFTKATMCNPQEIILR
jgi:hypothetical protein